MGFGPPAPRWSSWEARRMTALRSASPRDDFGAGAVPAGTTGRMVNFNFELIDFSGKNILPRVPGLLWEWALSVHLMRASPPQTLAKSGFQRALERRFQSPQSPCKMVPCCMEFMWEEAVLDWGTILLKLGEEVPAEAFNRCLKTLQAWEDDGALVLFAPNAYNRGVVVKAHLPRIRELRGGLVKVQVGASPKEEALGPLRAGAPSRASSVPTTKLAAAKTFEIFVPSGCNKAALKSAQDMADGRDCEPRHTGSARASRGWQDPFAVRHWPPCPADASELGGGVLARPLVHDLLGWGVPEKCSRRWGRGGEVAAVSPLH